MRGGATSSPPPPPPIALPPPPPGSVATVASPPESPPFPPPLPLPLPPLVRVEGTTKLPEPLPEPPEPLSPFSLDCFWRSFCCFLLSPCSKLMIISLIRGRYTSKLCGLASWLKVCSRIVRNASGTLPRSAVSTPMAVKALQAMLNSDPSRTYTSETSASVAC